jgi:LmbE family N-acetylglucosaminyl deacetylase
MTEPTSPSADAPPPDLQPLDVQPTSVLAVVAHPDDLEYGAAAAVARWTRAGVPVAYLLVTRGEAGIDGMAPEKAGPVREEEERASAAVVGVETVEFLDHADGRIENTLRLRRDIAAAIRRHRPDTLLLFNHRELWNASSVNSPDHRAAGSAALDAVGDAANRWIFPDLLDAPHRVTTALVSGSPLATYALDVRDTVDLAVASLAEHRAYLDGLGDHAMSDPEVVRMFLDQVGTRFGGTPSVAFEVFRF